MPHYKHGKAWLTAAVEGGRTCLTRVAHRAPMRLLPMQPVNTTSATCALGSYGGGLLGGDIVELDVRAERGSTLAVTTQASTKIYHTQQDGAATQQKLTAEVAAGALLVVAPDPLVPFARSAYAGHQSYVLEPGASLVAVDWVGSGRVSSGERWAHSALSTRTEVSWAAAAAGEPETAAAPSAPWLVEAMALPGGPGAALGFDLGGAARDAYATVVVVRALPSPCPRPPPVPPPSAAPSPPGGATDGRGHRPLLRRGRGARAAPHARRGQDARRPAA